MPTQRFAQAALLSAIGLFAAGTVHAASYELGTLGPTPVTLSESVGIGSFTDYLNFTIAAPDTYASGVAQNISFSYTSSSGNSVNALNISNFEASLYSIGASGSTLLLGPVAAGTTLSAALTSGNYFFELTGSGTGKYGGEYAITASAVAPVPEPAEATLMAVGLGLVGFLALRNKRQA